jgi:hypothetical protein
MCCTPGAGKEGGLHPTLRKWLMPSILYTIHPVLGIGCSGARTL